MSNKKIIEKVFENKFNREEIKEEILLKNSKKIFLKYFKYAFLPLCLILVLILAFALNSDVTVLSDKNIDTTYNNNSYTSSTDLHQDNIIINEILHMNDNHKYRLDIIKDTNFVFIPYVEELSNINTPKDFDNTQYYRILSKSIEDDNSDYTKLIQYEFVYFNTSNERQIVIAFSSSNKPIRDYHFSNGEASIINGISLVIYKYENTYMTEFNYHNINFDIETNNITKDEFLTLLRSIIN